MKTTKWLGYDFNSNGWSRTHENRSDAWAQFRRDFRSDVKNMLKGTGWELAEFGNNWFIFSGFLRNTETDKLVYFSISDVRYWQDAWYSHILVRTAKHLKDWTGGSNNYTSLPELVENLNRFRVWN